MIDSGDASPAFSSSEAARHFAPVTEEAPRRAAPVSSPPTTACSVSTGVSFAQTNGRSGTIASDAPSRGAAASSSAHLHPSVVAPPVSSGVAPCRPHASCTAEERTRKTSPSASTLRRGTHCDEYAATAATEGGNRKGPIMLSERSGDAKRHRHGGSEATVHGVVGDGGRVGAWKLAAAAASTNASRAALATRSFPHIPLQSPVSPSSPLGIGGGCLSTAVPVQRLYRVPAAFYGGGPLPSAPSFVATAAAAAAAAVGGTRSSNNRSYVLPGVQESDVFGAAPRRPPSAPVEERVRRAAQAFASDTRGSSAVRLLLGGEAVQLDEDSGVRVERGYRCMSSASPSSFYDCEEKCGHPFSSNDPASMAHLDGCHEGGAVPLLVGAKRRRGSARGFSRAASVANSISFGGGGGGGENAPSRDSTAASRLFPGSPAASSFSRFQSPQSPAIPPLTISGTGVASLSSSISAFARSANNKTSSTAVLATTVASAAAASAAPASPSPFCALVDVFSEEHAGLTALTTANARKRGATTSGSKEASSAKPESASAEAVLKALPWLRLWVSGGLSRCLAAQLERDVDVLLASTVVEGTPSTGESSSRTGVAAAAAAAALTGVRTSGVERRRNEGSDEHLRAAGLVNTTHPPTATRPPPTLHEALLQLFDLLEHLEAQVVDVFTSALLAPDAESHRTQSPRASSPARLMSPRQAAAAAAASPSFPSSPPLRVKDVFGLVVQHWCDVLLPRWPSDLIALGYVEWWLRHPVWGKLMVSAAEGSAAVATHRSARTGAAPTEDTAGGVEAEAPVVTRSRTAPRLDEAGQQQQEGHLHLLQEVLAASSSEGMQRLFDTVVDAFIGSVQELLRCFRSIGAVAASAHSALDDGNRCVGRQVDVLVSEDTYGVWNARCGSAGRRCRELLRLLVRLYAEPPTTLQRVLSEAAPSSPSSSPTLATVVGLKATGTAPAKEATEDEEGGISRSSAASPASPANGSGTRAEEGRPPNTPFEKAAAPSQPPPQRHPADERARVRQLHYQLLYAVCRLCSALPLSRESGPESYAGAESEIRSAASAWRVDRVLPRSPSSSGFSPLSDIDCLEMFATAVQLAAAVAVPLSSTQLPMKGDLLCVTSRLAQQRLLLLQRGWLREREYALCMAHLSTLLTQST
ncbi:hypothetical protein ABB37_07734 [Leptomonas pyrrhocoris]|uniref:Uncharacterized protein n=1 Tax=Leptomonas pyrrhocoris TaxID=157538 RepID=A0A0M9FUY0_LEPPY|nr:hypothetical protein ABB37_07734 [Leptomonas pyrrhocoris]KPA76396.1 hypothetical protein ABB37_07734 [Leptomonas pyrrhocoris]|eukprot:XP_015654835.1 hypothetical protein ABB37_07734 [Leptomonas pyrrhocoris]